ncbi:hypothetical protein KKB40_03080, partial [Patescibacteria group bacterium]|nr:hypothetical protein [Patescibacteria group bacterium]
LDPIPLTPIPSDIGTCLCESGIPVEEEDNCIPLYSPYCQDDVACICEGFGIIVTVTPIPQPTNTPALP